MAEAWLTMEKVCALTGYAARTVRFKAQRGELNSRPSQKAGVNGKPQREYLLSSLPASAQAKFAEETRKGLLVVPAAEQTLPLFRSVPNSPAAQTEPRVAIPEDLEDQARARLEAIRPLLDFRDRTNGHRPTIRLGDGRSIDRLADLAEYVGAQQNPKVSSRTLFRWLARWDKARASGLNSYTALADRQRKDAQGAGSRSLDALSKAYLEKKYLLKEEGDLSMLMSWEALVRDWSKVLDKKGRAPSYDTARGYLRGLSPGLKTLARVGPEAYVSKHSPFIIRGKQPVMQTWNSDHRVHDVLVRNRMFAEKKCDEAYRMWLTAIYDMGSHAIVGYCFSPQPSWRTIHSAIRMAAMEYGFPQEFYWDNGEDFKKAKRNLERIAVTNAILGFNFRITSALPKHPRSKPIEAYFTRISKRFDPMWGAAYLGNNPKNRSEASRAAEYEHNKYLAGKREKSPLPTDAEFLAAAVRWIAEYNSEARLECLDGRTPYEALDEAYPERKRPKMNPRALDILLWEPVFRVVQKGGSVEMDKTWYEPTEESLYAMSHREGQRLRILRDPYNLADAVAVTEKGDFIGELRLKQYIDQDIANPITRDQIQAAMREQRRLKRTYAQHIALLSLLAQHWGWKTERELLLERAGVMMTGTDGTPMLPAGALPAGVAPGAVGGHRAQLPRPRVQRQLQPAFVSDAVAEDADVFRDVKVED
jgi:hypothetical protein